MRKINIIISLLTILLLVTIVAVSPVLAGKDGKAGKSNMAHLYLYEKDSSWSIVDGGAWGKLAHNQSGSMFEYVMNGHGLVPGGDYTLIYYPDPWPGNGLICLGEGLANNGGNVHLKASVDTGDLPILGDTNLGAKIWLVQSADVDCDTQNMVGWNPTEYLFENDLIMFDDLDV